MLCLPPPYISPRKLEKRLAEISVLNGTTVHFLSVKFQKKVFFHVTSESAVNMTTDTSELLNRYQKLWCDNDVQ